MEYMLMPLKRYADFQGRSRRKEFWMFELFLILITIVLEIPLFASMVPMLSRASDAAPSFSPVTIIFGLLLVLFFIAVLIPYIAVQVRRLHDTDRSGWWLLLGVVPIVNYIGAIVLLVFYCLDGTRGPNRFGADPKSDNLADVFR